VHIIYLQRGRWNPQVRARTVITYLGYRRGPPSGGRQEVVMQTIGLVMFTVIGVALYAALSMALYMGLPRFAFECGSRHGRYAALGTRDREVDNTPTGSARMTGFGAADLLGQAA
jgi:hypothetical protein